MRCGIYPALGVRTDVTAVGLKEQTVRNGNVVVSVSYVESQLASTLEYLLKRALNAAYPLVAGPTSEYYLIFPLVAYLNADLHKHLQEIRYFIHLRE